MKKSYYEKFARQQLELRDYLALERTILSNERTLLSYSQNGLAFVVTGITGFYAVESQYIRAGALFLIFAGISIALLGVVRFLTVKSRLDLASPAKSADIAANELSTAQAEKAEEKST